MHTKSGSIKIMIGNETDEIIEERFDSFLQKCEKGLEYSVVFDSVDLLY